MTYEDDDKGGCGMETVETRELEGKALDWCVAISVRKSVLITKNGCVWTSKNNVYKDVLDYPWNPSSNWGHGGPLIDKYGVSLTPICNNGGYMAEWDMPTGFDDYDVFEVTGDTALIAVCRAVVQQNLGFEVEVPEELL